MHGPTDEATYRLETPDNVELRFDLAGPGSRFCALCIDGAIVSAAVAGVLLAVLIFGLALPSALREARFFASDGKLVVSWTIAVLFIVLAAANSSYHAIFELFMRGQTPGKRALKIRAISDEGTAMSPSQVLLRNVLRAVDFFPGCYAVGGIVALLSPSYRRLGDLAAGTIVVKEGTVTYQARPDLAPAPKTAASVSENEALGPEEAKLVRNFLSRRQELVPAARGALAKRIAEALFAKYGGVWQNPESYLERLSQGRHHEG